MADMGGKLISSGLRFVVVASRFNAVVVDRLLDGALDAFERTGSTTRGCDRGACARILRNTARGAQARDIKEV